MCDSPTARWWGCCMPPNFSMHSSCLFEQHACSPAADISWWAARRAGPWARSKAWRQQAARCRCLAMESLARESSVREWGQHVLVRVSLWTACNCAGCLGRHCLQIAEFPCTPRSLPSPVLAGFDPTLGEPEQRHGPLPRHGGAARTAGSVAEELAAAQGSSQVSLSAVLCYVLGGLSSLGPFLSPVTT